MENIDSKAFYDEKWNEWNDMIYYSPAPRHRRRIITSLIKKYASDGYSLHDVGCGNGFFLTQIRQVLPFLRLSGSDISAEAIEKNTGTHLDMEFYHVDIGETISHPNKYDIVTCCEVLEHVEDLKLAISNLEILLKPNGVAIVTLPSGKVYPIDKMVGHHRHFDDAEQFATKFDVIDEIHWGFPFFNLYKWAINIRPEQMSNAFCKSSYGLTKKLISNFIYFLFFLNLPMGGNQLFLTLRSKGTAKLIDNRH